MKKNYIALLILLAFSSCKEKVQSNEFVDSELIRQVGDIESNPELDGDFENCNTGGYIPQYYAYYKKPYKNGKLSFEKFIKEQYEKPSNSDESGLLRIRFVINCKGESGRFRLLAMNENYEKITFNTKISDQLLAITKQYKDWRILEKRGFKSDYYFYVTFKIDRGEIKEILP